MSKNQITEKPKHRCPVCGSDDLLIYEETAWVLNTGDFFCHSVKVHDSDAKVCCNDGSCNWIGKLEDTQKEV